MFFDDYTKTGYIYHIAPINDLNKILNEGIRYDDKVSYMEKYIDFHRFIDERRPDYIPKWVERKKAIFASMNYRDNPGFHSHTVVLAIKVNPERCWVANESRANQIYEPFILKDIRGFESVKEYLNKKGIDLIKEYWASSLSFTDNLKERKDLSDGYDGEVLIFHPIPPEDIKLLFIVSDHRVLTLEQWTTIFAR